MNETLGSIGARALLLAFVACGGQPAGGGSATDLGAAGTSRATPVASAPAPAVSTRGVGIDDPANDPALVAHARKVLACAWTYSADWPDGCQGPVDAWRKLPLGGKAATLVRFVGDEDPRVRFMGAMGLGAVHDWQDDEAIAGALLDALTKYENDASALWLAEAAGSIEPMVTGLGETMRRIAVALPNPHARATLVTSAQRNSPDVFYETTLALARTEKDAWVRHAAVKALGNRSPSSKRAEVCAVWLERTKDENARVALEAAYLIATKGAGCPAEYEALAALLDEVTKGKVETSEWVLPLRKLAESTNVPSRLKKTLVTIGTRIAERLDNAPEARVEALRAVVAADGKAGTSLAKKLQKDPDEAVKQAAAELATRGR